MSVWNEIPGQAGYDGNVKPERMTEFYQGTMRAGNDEEVKAGNDGKVNAGNDAEDGPACCNSASHSAELCDF